MTLPDLTTAYQENYSEFTLLGLRRPWGFYENGLGATCRNVRLT
jgi:hypothetical protein